MKNTSILSQLAAEWQNPPAAVKPPRLISKDEAVQLLSGWNSPRHRLLFSLAFSGDLRISEIARIKAADIDIPGKTLAVRQEHGRKTRRLRLSDKLAAVFAEYIKQYEIEDCLFSK
jgi:integrase